MKKWFMNTSRRESNFISHMKIENREQYIKRFIASCNPEQLIPFIKIINHDKQFREIEYVINMPDSDVR